MSEMENTNQNFIPAQKPGAWQRFKNWVRFLSPKKKKIFVAFLLLLLVVVGVFVYYVLAAPNDHHVFFVSSGQDTSVYTTNNTSDSDFNDLHIDMAEGATTTVRLYTRLGTNDRGRTVNLNGEGDLNAEVLYQLGLNYDIILNGSSPSNNDLSINFVPSPELQSLQNSNYYCNYLSGSGNLGIDCFAYNLFSLGKTFDDGVNPQNSLLYLGDFEIYIRPNSDISSIDVTLAGGELRMGPDPALLNSTNPEDIVETNLLTLDYISTLQMHDLTITNLASSLVYLSPAQEDIQVGQPLMVDVMMNPPTDSSNNFLDVVAIEGLIEWDNGYLELINVEESADFPVQGIENETANSYRLVRGVQGDGDPNNPPPADQSGGVRVATLVFNTLQVTDSGSSEISLSSVRQVIDDGQGSTRSPGEIRGYYNITEEEPFEPNLVITDGPSVYVFQDAGNWSADFSWQTNMPADSEVLYGSTTGNDCAGFDFSEASSQSSANFVVDHLLIASGGLSLGQAYCYKVVSVAEDTNFGQVESEPQRFVVEEVGIKDFSIENLNIEPSYRSAVFTWNTVGGREGGLGNARVDCGNGLDVEKKDSYTLSHSLLLRDLTENTNYTCTINSQDRNKESVTITEDFTTLSGEAPDANVVLKVQRDRICDKWLECRSSMQIVNDQNQTENLCFDVGVCDEKDAEGNCLVGMTPASAGINLSNQTFEHPNQIQDMANLSGMAKVGMTWDDQREIEGYYNYAIMEPKGADIQIPNSNFEAGELWPWSEKSNAKISIATDPYEPSNHVLKYAPDARTRQLVEGDWSSIWVPVGSINPADEYSISFSAKSAEGATLRVQIWGENESAPQTIGSVQLSSNWQTHILTSDMLGSQLIGDRKNKAYLTFSMRYGTDSNFNGDVFLDNVSMMSVLPIQGGATDEESIYISRSCRMYPNSSAVACEYSDAGGKMNVGWRGFCVEEDPKYASRDESKQMCLNWWPVDVLPGETNIFSGEQQAGYQDRAPLYYCLESKGNYPYVRTTRNSHPSLLYKYCDQSFSGWLGSSLGGWFENNLGWTSLVVGGAYGLSAYLVGDQVNVGKVICGWQQASGRITTVTSEERQFDEKDIAYIKLVPLCEEGDDDKHCFSKKENKEAFIYLKPEDGWWNYMCNGANCQNRSYYERKGNFWESGNNMLNNNQICGNQAVDLFAARAVFDKGNFVGIQSGLCNWAADSNDRGFVRYKVVFYLKETCNVVAQVVTPDGTNMAWANKIQKDMWDDYADNVLKYPYSQDYSPYGAAVVGDPVSDPAKWVDPLYAMPPDDISGFSSPYQVRAGSPYAVESVRDLASGDKKIGSAQCIAGSEDNIGGDCEVFSDCGYNAQAGSYGACMGVNLDDDQINQLSLELGYMGAEKRLQNLFAKSYKIWKWGTDVDGNQRYIDVTGLCGNGTNACSVNANERYGWDYSSNSANLKYKPEVKNIKVNGRSSGVLTLAGPATVMVEFNSDVNEEHLPLKALRVDWGDGTARSQVENLKIYDRPDENYEPHKFVHTYVCEINNETDPDGDGFCEYTPKVQIMDNWGWCNDGDSSDKCKINTSDMEDAPVILEISP